MPSIRYSAESKEDLKQLARHIARDKPVAAHQWMTKLREKCRLVAKHPDVGDSRPELGDGIRSTYVGSYVFFRQVEGFLEIARVIRGDLDDPTV